MKKTVPYILYWTVGILTLWYFLISYHFVVVPLIQKTKQQSVDKKTLSNISWHADWDINYDKTWYQTHNTNQDGQENNENNYQKNMQTNYATIVETWQVCIGTKCYITKIARTDKQRQKWLQWVSSLASTSWMLFVFSQSWSYNFWMKDTLIALDILRINQNKEIVWRKINAEPCWSNICVPFGPQNVKSSYVLEVNAWHIERYWFKLWDKIVLSWIKD